MGLTFLGAFWFAGIAVGVALTVSMVSKHGTLVAIGLVALCLIALQALHLTAQNSCPGGECGTLGPLLAQIRLVLGGLTLAGAVIGLWMGHRLRRQAVPLEL